MHFILRHYLKACIVFLKAITCVEINAHDYKTYMLTLNIQKGYQENK